MCEQTYLEEADLEMALKFECDSLLKEVDSLRGGEIDVLLTLAEDSMSRREAWARNDHPDQVLMVSKINGPLMEALIVRMKDEGYPVEDPDLVDDCLHGLTIVGGLPYSGSSSVADGPTRESLEMVERLNANWRDPVLPEWLK